MTKIITHEIAEDKARIVDAPVARVTVDRSFELPRAIYAATVAAYLGFIAIMAAGFGNPKMVIPTAIFALFVVAGFGVPAVWTRIAPDHRSKPMTTSRFARDGIMTHTGRLTGRDATIQVLILPVLIVLWGLAVVTIAALV